jgi:hypothetical protein
VWAAQDAGFVVYDEEEKASFYSSELPAGLTLSLQCRSTVPVLVYFNTR